MTDSNQKDIDDWDPEEAMEKLSAKGLKIPVTFKRDDVEEPKMEMEVEDPKAKKIVPTKPKIIHKKQNKNELF